MNGHCQLVGTDAIAGQARASLTSLFPSGSQFRARDVLPAVESVLHFVTVGRRGESVTTWAEVLQDGTVGREEPLGITWGLEPLHTPLPLSRRLMRVLGAIVEIPMLAMFHPWKDLVEGSRA